LGKVRCAECDAEIKDAEAFVHEGKTYCPECTVEHVRAKHVAFFRNPP